MTPFEADVATMRASGLCAESDGDGCLCALPDGHREPHGWMGEDANREWATQERIRAAVLAERARCAAVCRDMDRPLGSHPDANVCAARIERGA